MASFITLPRNRLIRFAFKIIFLISIATFFIDIFSLNQFITDCTNQQPVGLVENRFLAVKLSPDHCQLKSSNLSKSPINLPFFKPKTLRHLYIVMAYQLDMQKFTSENSGSI